MEPDRFQQSPKAYTFGLIFMIISLSLFGLGAYLIPKIVFGLTYQIPDPIFHTINLVHEAYDLDEKKAGWLVLTIIFILACISSFVTYALSNRVDHEIHLAYPAITEGEEPKIFIGFKESGPLILKIILMIGVIFLCARLFEWVIAVK